MASYTVTTTDSEDEALAWAAQNSTAGQVDEDGKPIQPPGPEEYFDARMHDVLHSYEQQHAVATAVAPVDDVATEYAKASEQQQAQVANILGLQVSKPA